MTKKYEPMELVNLSTSPVLQGICGNGSHASFSPTVCESGDTPTESPYNKCSTGHVAAVNVLSEIACSEGEHAYSSGDHASGCNTGYIAFAKDVDASSCEVGTSPLDQYAGLNWHCVNGAETA